MFEMIYLFYLTVDCFNHPCANGGTCQPGEQNSCNCADGYTGNRCQC